MYQICVTGRILIQNMVNYSSPMTKGKIIIMAINFYRGDYDRDVQS